MQQLPATVTLQEATLLLVLLLVHCRLEAAGDGPDAYHKPGSAEADGEFEWLSPNERVRVPYSRNWPDLLQLAAEYDLCLTGREGGEPF